MVRLEAAGFSHQMCMFRAGMKPRGMMPMPLHRDMLFFLPKLVCFAFLVEDVLALAWCVC